MLSCPHSSDRVQWIDAMRGFSMLLVVFGHVLILGMDVYGSFLNFILICFRMPLFFFVSGFFSYRVQCWWSRDRVADILKRKFQAQIFCTVLFFALYCFYIGERPDFSLGFGGYWFTIVLFQMYIVYLVCSMVSRVLCHDIVIPLLVIAAIISTLILGFHVGRDLWLWDFLNWKNLMKYFQFFAAGIICAKYKNAFFKLLNNNIFILISVLGWIALVILQYTDWYRPVFPVLYYGIYGTVLRYCALFTVIIMFYGCRDFFAQNSRCSNWMCFIGQRTLDLYMIHFFLIPDLHWMSPFLSAGNMVIIQLLLAGIVTALITVVSLLISSILRRSSVLESFLFGVKYRIISDKPTLD